MNIGIRKILIKILNTFINYFWFITAIGAIIFFILAYIFIIKPKYNVVANELILQQEQVEKELLKQEKYLDDLIEEKNRLENIDQYSLDKMNKILPKEKNISNLIQKIEFFAQKSDFVLESLQIYELKENEPFLKKLYNKIALDSNINMLNIDISLSGADYNQLKQFLKILESDITIIDVITVRFKGVDSYNLRAITYYNNEGI
ncbi:hypothetical protein ACFL23_03435 [Patescibacteria group bacterium]